MFNIADNYSGQLWMNKRQGLSIPLPYIMSQPVTDPETELGVGQQTLNLFMIQFFRTRGALLLDDPTIYFLSKLQPTIVVPPPLYGFLHPHFAAFSKSTPPVAKSEREYRHFRGLVPTSLFSLRIFFA